MVDNVLSVLTFKSPATIFGVGGTQSWVLDRNRARACKYVVICRNANHPDVEGAEEHGTAFMIGRVKDVVPSSETPGRWNVLLSDYVVRDFGEQWEGRNPVAYWTTADYPDIPFDSLNFEPMPDAGTIQIEDGPAPEIVALTIAQAKAGLCRAFGVDPSAIEITIRG